MAAEGPAGLKTVGDWLDVTVDRFNKAGLAFGHGSTNARDEAAYLLLHTLKLPLDELDSVLGRRLTPAETQSLEIIVRRRADEGTRWSEDGGRAAPGSGRNPPG